MTLKQAFKLWSVAPRNLSLANRYRTAVNSVLMKRYGETELCLINEEFARNIFASSDVAPELKTRAASILVYLLQWGGDHGHCGRPTFDFTIANTPSAEQDPHRKRGASSRWIATTPRKPKSKKERGQRDDQKEQDGQAEPKPESPSELSNAEVEQKPESESEKSDNMISGTDSEIDNRKVQESKSELGNDTVPESESGIGNAQSGKRKKINGRPPRPIAQIDPGTLKVVKEWQYLIEAERETGACNLGRCISLLHMSAGFYWCDAGDADTFKDRLTEKKVHNRNVQLAHVKEMREAKGVKNRENGEKIEDPVPQQQIQQVPKKLPNPTHFIQSKEEILEMILKKEHHTDDKPDNEPSHRERAQQALAVFTDRELINELERRGWVGCFSRTEIITIGKK